MFKYFVFLNIFKIYINLGVRSYNFKKNINNKKLLQKIELIFKVFKNIINICIKFLIISI